jgi:hypothetical protein
MARARARGEDEDVAVRDSAIARMSRLDFSDVYLLLLLYLVMLNHAGVSDLNGAISIVLLLSISVVVVLAVLVGRLNGFTISLSR